MLEHAPWSRPLAGARVADVFAGSGALGLEALSRGAAFCLFIDHDREARAAVAANLESLDCGVQARVLAADAARSAVNADAPFDLALLDPPYGLSAGGWLAPDARIAIERGADEPALEVAGYKILDTRRWGAARVWFLKPH